MGRDNRAFDPQSLYHLVTRGNNGEPIVCDHIDCESWVAELGRVALKYRWEVWAWCLIPNHYHVVVRAPQGGLSEGMQELNGNHARRMNRRHGRTGHLVRNRFFDVELESDAHVVAAVIYVARNAVAAGLCRTPEVWPYGSYRATVGLEPEPPWLVSDDVLCLFGRDPAAARASFRDFVRAGHVLVSDTSGHVLV